MKYAIILFLSFFILISGVFGENVSVELTPNNISANVGDTINLDLVVKNIPSDKKCAGFETKIHYNTNLLNLTNIVLSNTSNTASLKTVDISKGKISLIWFNNPPYGNFTIATLSFKALKDGNDSVDLTQTSVSDANGVNYDITLKNSNITINPLNQTLGIIALKDFELNKNIDAVLSITGAKTPIKNISGIISFKNITIENNPTLIDIFCNNFSYVKHNNNISFFIIPNEKDENKTIFNLLKIPINVNDTNYNISVDLMINGEQIKNITIKTEEKHENISEYKGLAFYVDSGHNEKTNITFGHSKEIKLKVFNIDKNLTNISGYIFINNSLFDVSDYGIPEYSDIYNTINTSNITLNNNYLYLNISLINGTNGTFSILKFKISPKVDKNISSTIYLKNLSVYANNTKINLTVKNLTIDIVKRKTNHPPKLKMAYNIFNNNEVHFYALSYDEDNDDLKYIWNFGDGQNSTDENPIHRYSNYSTYKIKCTVKDPLNGTDEVVTIIELKKYYVVNYSFSKDSFLSDDNKNKTVYLNMTLRNPLTHNVNGYINFLDYKDYTPLKTQYNITLKPNETKKLIIPINVSKSCNINWNVVYYPAIKNNGKYNVEMGYYQWNFEKKIEFTSKPQVKVNNYTKIIKLNNTKVVLKVNKVKTVKNYVINKTITSSDNYMAPYYSFVSLFGFMIGLILIRFKIK
ncbi:PKD domain-containing protein [Methanothermococcus okinawensis]|uniref:PKD domain containing protein n=1 Tax=Methanothermococcus okinawensis (strain DSM 14208 / JCM 11175 / IH1) TaxID=647113 RepID=F8AJM0_METOI|nr:PKD domain-containing protein [Methanothermococcus okinawensis]AEH07206.1 PKD domain containing protein [Methanothermococcus okinawensis IH1]